MSGCRASLFCLLLADGNAFGADRGTAYASAVETADARILLVSGQGDARQIVRLDPKWLESRAASDDFSRGLRCWTVAKDQQAEASTTALVAHPTKTGRRILRLQPSAGGRTVAQWNFPAGFQGTLKIRMQLSPELSGITLSLTDHFSLPVDQAAREHAVFSTDVRPRPAADGDVVLSTGVWHELAINWQADSPTARASVDNQPAATLRRRRETNVGLNYLRIEATAAQAGSASLLIEQVSVDATPGADVHQAHAGAPPQRVGPAPADESVVVRLPDDSLRIFYIARPDGKQLRSISSSDNGLTWGDPQTELDLPGAAYHAVQVLVDRHHRLHAVFHVLEQAMPQEGYRGRLYNLWHSRKDSPEAPWSKPRQFFRGYVGALRGFTEAPSGRLLAAFAFAVPARMTRPESGVDYGWNDVTVCYSDDGGETWQRSSSRLKVAQDNSRGLTRYGGLEPHIVRLDDGRLWMLIRTKNGFLYESYSTDHGALWSEPQPTRFISSDSPACVLRLQDGREVIFFNGCQRYDDPRSYAVGGREVLHAAIRSRQEDAWSGFREVLQEFAGDENSESAVPMEFKRRRGTKTGGAVLDLGSAGSFDDQWVSCPSVTFDGCRYRMWYSSFYDYSQSPGGRGVGLALSSDGLHWERANDGKPVFVPGPPGSLDDGQVMGPEVLFDGEIYRMWYTGQPRERHASGLGYYRIFLATSRDGEKWTRASDGQPVLDIGPSGSYDSVQAATPSIVRDEHGFRMWYAAWAPNSGHVVCSARSRDGVQWQRDNGGRPVEGLTPRSAYGPAVTRIAGRYVMLYMASGARPDLYGAFSSDGLHWTMAGNGQPVIVRGEADDFDDAIVGHPFLLTKSGRLLAWYTGYRREPNGAFPWRLRIGAAEATLNFHK